MPWPDPPYPPGFQPPGIGFILLMGGIVFCFIVLSLYLTVRAALALAPSPPPSEPDSGTKTGPEGKQLS